MNVTCPVCQKADHNPIDKRFGWCLSCNQFVWAQEPHSLDMNLIIADFQFPNRHDLALGSPFSFQLEQFLGGDGTMKWRALVKIGQRVWKHSLRDQLTPHDAIRELSEIVLEEISRTS